MKRPGNLPPTTWTFRCISLGSGQLVRMPLGNSACAIELAEALNRRSGGRQPAVLDILAAAYALRENFPRHWPRPAKPWNWLGERTMRI